MEEKQYKENIFLSIAANIVVPALLLSKGAKWFPNCAPYVILLIALAFPVIYFCYDYFRSGDKNFVSIVGFLGTLLTGVIGLFQLSPIWVAVKESAVPAFIAILLICFRERVIKLLFSKRVFNIEKIEAAFKEKGTRKNFDESLKWGSIFVIASFILSTGLNFFLARAIVVTEPSVDPVAFNEEIGKMLALSWPVIALPCMVFHTLALIVVIRGLKRATGLSLEDCLNLK